MQLTASCVFRSVGVSELARLLAPRDVRTGSRVLGSAVAAPCFSSRLLIGSEATLGRRLLLAGSSGVYCYFQLPASGQARLS